MKHYQLTAGSTVLTLLLFGALGISAVTGNMLWFTAVAILDGAAVIAFALSAPEHWR